MIFFNVKEVREFLLNNGIVYTLRRPRSIGITEAVQGNYYQRKVLGLVRVEFVKSISHTEAKELEQYLPNSGLQITAEEWLEKAQDLSKSVGLDLYRVQLLRKEGDQTI